MCDHLNREAAMIVTHRDDEGIPTIWCDPCLAPIVKALNDGGVRTRASCCGHTRGPGSILLADGRELLLLSDSESRERRFGAAQGEGSL